MFSKADTLILLALWTLLPAFATGQDQSLTKEVQSPKKFVFSGAVTEADCLDLPTSSFEVSPSNGPQGGTTNRLVIDCLPTQDQKNVFTLTLTFLITEAPPASPDLGNRSYYFRWGESKASKQLPMVGEFTKDENRCVRFASLFTTKVSRDAASTTEHLLTSPRWSVSCNGDDLWGTSMEFELRGRFPIGQDFSNDSAGFDRQYRPAFDVASSGNRDQLRRALDRFALPAEWFQQMFGPTAEQVSQQYKTEFDYFEYAEARRMQEYKDSASVMQVDISPQRSTANPPPKSPPASLQPLPPMEAVHIKLVDSKSGSPKVSWMNTFVYVEGAFLFLGGGAYPFWDPVRIHRPDTCDPQGHQPGGRLLAPVTPMYPEEAKSKGVQGTVRLRVDVTKDGSVSSADIMNGDPLLADSAIAAAKQWRYQPFMNCGQPMEAQAVENVRYSLAGSNASVTIVAPSMRPRISSGVAAANLVHRVDPIYPKESEKAKLQGRVVLELMISKEGEPHDISVVSGTPELVDAALDAVRQWRYKPYVLNGEPVEVQTVVQINFTLGQ
jgi:TonB family protein